MENPSVYSDLDFLVLQYLNDFSNYSEAARRFGQVSGIFFNMKYFERLVSDGNWEEVERYLSGFTKMDDNSLSLKILFEIRKHKYLEALDRNDKSLELDILLKELKVIASKNNNLLKEITSLIVLDNFRQNEHLCQYGDRESARMVLFSNLKRLIDTNPVFRGKLKMPPVDSSRLRVLMNQSLTWQHQQCKYPQNEPIIETLFHSHSCPNPNGAHTPSPAPEMMGVMQRLVGSSPLGPDGVSNEMITPATSNLIAGTSNITGRMTNAALMHPHPAVSAASIKRPMTAPSGNPLDHHSADSEHALKRPLHMSVSQEATSGCIAEDCCHDLKPGFFSYKHGFPSGSTHPSFSWNKCC